MKDFTAQKWMKFYWMRLTLIGAVFAFIFWTIYNTQSISVSINNDTLICPDTIPLQNAKSIDDYYYNFAPDLGLASQICTFDHVFDNSSADRIHLLKFAQDLLDKPITGRPDIAQHFYKKIIASNPNDALSDYIRIYKMR